MIVSRFLLSLWLAAGMTIVANECLAQSAAYSMIKQGVGSESSLRHSLSSQDPDRARVSHAVAYFATLLTGQLENELNVELEVAKKLKLANTESLVKIFSLDSNEIAKYEGLTVESVKDFIYAANPNLPKFVNSWIGARAVTSLNDGQISVNARAIVDALRIQSDYLFVPVVLNVNNAYIDSLGSLAESLLSAPEGIQLGVTPFCVLNPRSDFVVDFQSELLLRASHLVDSVGEGRELVMGLHSSLGIEALWYAMKVSDMPITFSFSANHDWLWASEASAQAFFGDSSRSALSGTINFIFPLGNFGFIVTDRFVSGEKPVVRVGLLVSQQVTR